MISQNHWKWFLIYFFVLLPSNQDIPSNHLWWQGIPILCHPLWVKSSYTLWNNLCKVQPKRKVKIFPSNLPTPVDLISLLQPFRLKRKLNDTSSAVDEWHKTGGNDVTTKQSVVLLAIWSIVQFLLWWVP